MILYWNRHGVCMFNTLGCVSCELLVFLVNYHRLELHHFHKVWSWFSNSNDTFLYIVLHYLHKFSDLYFIFRWILFEPTVRCIWHNNDANTNILHLISWHQLCYSNSIHIFTCKSRCDAIKLSSKMKCFLQFQHYYRSMDIGRCFYWCRRISEPMIPKMEYHLYVTMIPMPLGNWFHRGIDFIVELVNKIKNIKMSPNEMKPRNNKKNIEPNEYWMMGMS